MKKDAHSKEIQTFNFSQFIDEIETNIQSKYIGGCINWVDENHNNAWSRAKDSFDRHLYWAMGNQNYNMLKGEGERYTQTCLKYIKLYNDHKDQNKPGQKIKNIGAMMNSVSEG